MKKLLKRTGIIIVLLLALSFISPYAIPGIDPIVEVEAATVKLNKTKITINVGETYQLKLTGTKSKVIWSSGKKSIAIVSSDGLVTGKKKGSVIITAKVDGDEYECTVNVVVPFINSKRFQNGIGGKTQFLVYNLPKENSAKDVYWKSSDEKIFTVDENGLVTATGIGSAKLTAVYGSNKLTKTIYINPTKQNLQDAVGEFKIDYIEINNTIFCDIINNSKIDITTNYQLEFYDAADKLISISTSGIMHIFKGDESIVTFVKPEKEYKYYKLKFDKINVYFHQLNQKDKVTIEIKEYDYIYEYNDWSNSVQSQIKDTIKVFDMNINNQSGKRVYFNASILYYKNNTLVSYSVLNSYYDLDIGITTIEKPQLQYALLGNRKLTLPEYDTYRIIYTAATNKY